MTIKPGQIWVSNWRKSSSIFYNKIEIVEENIIWFCSIGYQIDKSSSVQKDLTYILSSPKKDFLKNSRLLTDNEKIALL